MVWIREQRLQDLLLRLAAEDLRAFLPSWLDDFNALSDKKCGAIFDTLTALAATSLNVLKAAHRLGVHANTVYARVARIHELTGLDPRRFDDLNELLIAVRTSRGTA